MAGLVCSRTPGGLKFDDFDLAYLIGSIALAVILFEGGLKTNARMLRLVFWPALTLATLGVLLSAGILASTLVLFVGVSWPCPS